MQPGIEHDDLQPCRRRIVHVLLGLARLEGFPRIGIVSLQEQDIESAVRVFPIAFFRPMVHTRIVTNSVLCVGSVRRSRIGVQRKRKFTVRIGGRALRKVLFSAARRATEQRHSRKQHNHHPF